eukprot:1146841-Pelagomonas_calceolata.AAC.4
MRRLMAMFRCVVSPESLSVSDDPPALAGACGLWYVCMTHTQSTKSPARAGWCLWAVVRVHNSHSVNNDLQLVLAGACGLWYVCMIHTQSTTIPSSCWLVPVGCGTCA